MGVAAGSGRWLGNRRATCVPAWWKQISRFFVAVAMDPRDLDQSAQRFAACVGSAVKGGSAGAGKSEFRAGAGAAFEGLSKAVMALNNLVSDAAQNSAGAHILGMRTTNISAMQLRRAEEQVASTSQSWHCSWWRMKHRVHHVLSSTPSAPIVANQMTEHSWCTFAMLLPASAAEASLCAPHLPVRIAPTCMSTTPTT